MKKALITGITGQDGSYLAEFLLTKGYEVHGIIRRASTFNTHRIDHIYIDPHNPSARIFLHYGDLTDVGLITDVIYNIRPDEIYHLGAQSHVRVSFDLPEYTGDVTGLGTTRMLEAIRRSGIKTKFYQASSSEMFGGASAPQSEKTPFAPRSPYAVAKVYSYWLAVNYREAYNLFVTNGILFNHESPRRGETFVSRKITRALANILAGKQRKLFLGNLDARRDWGFAPEYVEAMWLMLQTKSPEDYVIGTGTSHTVRQLLEHALRYVDIEVVWRGKGANEKGIIQNVPARWKNVLRSGEPLVEIDEKYFRPTEVEDLRADASKAAQHLGWKPRMGFDELVMLMVDHDLKSVGIEPPGRGITLQKEKSVQWTNNEFSFHSNIKEGIG